MRDSKHVEVICTKAAMLSEPAHTAGCTDRSVQVSMPSVSVIVVLSCFVQAAGPDGCREGGGAGGGPAVVSTVHVQGEAPGEIYTL
jgi:hypothetical protein